MLRLLTTVKRLHPRARGGARGWLAMLTVEIAYAARARSYG